MRPDEELEHPEDVEELDDLEALEDAGEVDAEDSDIDEEDVGEEEVGGVPQAVLAACPDCGEETTHAVLKGSVGTRGGYTLDATVQCEECDRVHHVVLREPAPIDLPVIVSYGAQSVKTRALFSPADYVAVGDEFVLNERRVQVTGIELPSARRTERANLSDVQTIWVKDFETVLVPVAINLKRKTVSKRLPANPEEEYTVGQEVVFGRLRVTVHAIKTVDRLLKRGTAPARDIQRMFARPTRLGKTYRPPPEMRARLRAGRAFENM